MIESLLSPSGAPVSSAAVVPVMLARLSAAQGFAPFAPLLKSFVADLSRSVLTDRAFREHPELMAMAHWFRAANLPALQARLLNAESDTGDLFQVRRGVVFHIAPSNVDSVFIYSWLLSLLCGNANIARVSRRRTAQMQTFFAQVHRLLQREEFAPLAESNWVLSYDHDAELTAQLSAACHLRVIWGGDATIEQIRRAPLPALAGELAFANRFSMALLKAEAVLSLESAQLKKLAQGFYNDTFWFNQRACSSPRAVWWVGDAASCEAARAKFWPALQAEIEKHQPENTPAQVMNRATMLYALAQAHPGAKACTPIGALPTRIEVASFSELDRRLHDGQGLFIELLRPDLLSVMASLSTRDQTLAQFGFGRSEWVSVLSLLPPHAADRIVPVGEALAFSSVWDGVDLLSAFTRVVQIGGR